MAYNFAGGTDRIAYGGAGWAPVTVGCTAFWMKTTQTTVNATPFTHWSLASRNGYGFIINNTLNKIMVQAYDPTTARVALLSTTSINGGNWRHIAFNWDTANGGANALFVDGVSEATGNSSAAWPLISTAPPSLGDSNDGFWPSYVGDLAEYGIWRRQLDAAEIAALAKGFAPSRVARDMLHFYAPLVRDPHILQDAFITGPVGATVSVHPRII